MKILDLIKALPWKGGFNLIVAIVCAVAILRTCAAERRYAKLLKERPPVEVTPVMVEAEELSRTADSLGREKVVYLLSDPIIKYIENSKADSFAKEAEVDKNRITAMSKLNARLARENLDMRREIGNLLDSLSPDTIWRYRDRWLSFNASIPNDSVIRVTDLTMDVSVNRVDHNRKKRWLFGTTENLSTVWFDNPHIEIEGLETLRIQRGEPKTEFNLSVDSRVLVRPSEFQIGPKASLRLGRFRVNGGYHVNTRGSDKNTLWYGGEYILY